MRKLTLHHPFPTRSFSQARSGSSNADSYREFSATRKRGIGLASKYGYSIVLISPEQNRGLKTAATKRKSRKDERLGRGREEKVNVVFYAVICSDE